LDSWSCIHRRFPTGIPELVRGAEAARPRQELGNDLGDFDLDVRHPGDFQNVTRTSFKDFAVVAFERLSMNPDPRPLEVYDPEFRGSRRRIARHLDESIEPKRRIRHFDHEKGVTRPGNTLRIRVGSRSQQGDVRVKVIVLRNSERSMPVEESAFAEPFKNLDERPHTSSVSISDGCHLDDLPVDELEAIFIREYARLDDVAGTPSS
jgi:hypothetical protein